MPKERCLELVDMVSEVMAVAPSAMLSIRLRAYQVLVRVCFLDCVRNSKRAFRLGVVADLMTFLAWLKLSCVPV
jgi:hypothetical protein